MFDCNVMINSELILPKALSYANFDDLTLYKFEEFHPHVYPQYRYQYVCAASLNSPANLLSNGELLKLNHRISIDHETYGGVLMVSNPIGLQGYSR
ncbi:hypothetical protein T08_3823 [Trichinella sp. T8]|nr:hypothetical protein T08_3823 [Trichinella sp. T8]